MGRIPGAARMEQPAPALPTVWVSVLLWHRDLGAALGEDGIISWEGLGIKRGG